MIKPRKKRDVLYPPGALYFKPQGIPMPYLGIVNLTVDEYEALRLADLEGLKHEEAAKQMNISRPTFTRLLESAHSRVSDAIVNGKAIRITGGDYRLIGNRMRCRACGRTWISDEHIAGDPECPSCSSTDIEDVAEMLSAKQQPGKKGRYGHGWRK